MKSIAMSLVGLFLAGCVGVGSMIPGTISSQSGDILDFQIEKAYRSGRVSAHNGRTGETFSGTYVATMSRTTAISSSFDTVSVGSNMANSSAYLKGNKGSMLQCRMQIEAGLSPHGIGSCSDQTGAAYALQF